MNEKTIREILKKRLYVNPELLIPENDSKPLTGEPFRLDGIEMAYLYLDIKRQCHKEIPPQKLQEYGFNTISSIADIIRSL